MQLLTIFSKTHLSLIGLGCSVVSSVCACVCLISPIHTGRERANLWAIPLKSLASSVYIIIHNRFHLLALRLCVQCGLGLTRHHFQSLMYCLVTVYTRACARCREREHKRAQDCCEKMICDRDLHNSLTTNNAAQKRWSIVITQRNITTLLFSIVKNLCLAMTQNAANKTLTIRVRLSSFAGLYGHSFLLVTLQVDWSCPCHKPVS